MSDVKGKVTSFFERGYRKLDGFADDSLSSMTKQMNRLRDERFCLGITGLSQSGKSTFITSLINQLLQYETSALPGFPPVLDGRLLGVKMHPLEEKGLAEFPYDEAYKGLTDAQPSWPASTSDLSGCLLELRLAKAASKLNPFSREQYSLYLEIRDYPGEWLLDLPMRDMGFSRWCAQCSAMYTQSPRTGLLGATLSKLQKIDPLAECDEEELKAINQEFVGFLRSCKDSGLSLIQPGRFLIPGTTVDTDALKFIPLLRCGGYSEGQLEAASENSYFKVCQQRYERYKKELVDPFYASFFGGIERQLVLVDVVSALNSGAEYVDDMRQALSNISDSFSYGKQNRLRQLFNPKIDKVVFAATKIDQVLSEDHEAVRQLLGTVVKQAYQNAQHEGVRPVCEATAAVRSSQEIEHEEGKGIVGVDSSGKSVGYVHPTITARIPEGEEWKLFNDWKIPELGPPKGLSYQNGDPVPHIRMDTIINALIGDKCE